MQVGVRRGPQMSSFRLLLSSSSSSNQRWFRDIDIGVQRKVKWLSSTIATGNHASSQNMAKINAGRKVLVGRNTQKGGDETDLHEEKEGSSNYPKLEISGNDAPKKSMDAESTSHKNTQDNSNVEYASKNPTYIPPKSTPIFSHEHHHQSSAHRQKDNYPKEFLETADNDDVINLMRRDYRGTDRPRRKPPINNHEPSD